MLLLSFSLFAVYYIHGPLSMSGSTAQYLYADYNSHDTLSCSKPLFAGQSSLYHVYTEH